MSRALHRTLCLAAALLAACGGGDPDPEPPVDCKALGSIAPPAGKPLPLPPECEPAAADATPTPAPRS